jgi:hypothetical protein
MVSVPSGLRRQTAMEFHTVAIGIAELKRFAPSVIARAVERDLASSSRCKASARAARVGYKWRRGRARWCPAAVTCRLGSPRY